ncbi:MAG: hypothetical protein AB7S36_02170 [Planctomycetota bacterium]
MVYRVRRWCVAAVFAAFALGVTVWVRPLLAQDPAPPAQGGDADDLKALVAQLAARVDTLTRRVTVLEAEVRDLRAQLLAGGAAASPSATSGEFSFEVDGQLAFVVKEGPVEKGQLIAELDRVEVMTRLAGLDEKISSAKISVNVQRKWAIEAQSAQMAAKAEVEAARQDMSRLAGEVQAGRAPQSAYDAAHDRWAAALNDASRNNAKREMHERQGAKAQEEIDRLQKVQADLRASLPKYRMTAPANGKVSGVRVEAGQNLMAGTPVLEFTPDR